ncbi:methylated-DNA--[protein]-cysteine S-methyltransferase [Chlorogloea sp. CCALA 695]|uniref:methylated-DNA--[protein]-cysteine S-methyltransferase n=1 Tax=Chlorogloea sp. CCALA 695 TaxID=2107693 RepID=UPI000D0631E7|nr:methylated-DNA--[protein]-cysteine S-methyltransferase [Chlorogloea sp. CCALA 695]PSB35472.1 6-O-methylguanine DNA methyltransferase [Chlorogloea sp. CCALA 695]
MTSFVETSNYQLIAKAIAFISENHLQQPDLATVATHVNLSEYHFQKLFTRWAGISPKRFLQYLTVEYAKAKIAETKSLLNLTGDVGLSSPGRLHDLFVTLEAMSPGEFKTGGTGLQIIYGVHESPFGKCLIAMTVRGICNLRFLDDTCQDVEQLLRLEWSKAEIVQDRQATKEICDRIFAPIATNQPLVLFVKGTNFQIQVWRGLLRVPFGGLATYQSLANAIGRPTSARAVGNALGNNPVGYLIPCHRVIRESGELGGFRWGLERKKVLLGWEASQNQDFPKNNTSA